MNVLLLCNKSPWPPKEGGPIAMYAMIKGLLLAGISVKVLALNTNKYSVDVNDIPEDARKKINSLNKLRACLNLYCNNCYNVFLIEKRQILQR